MCTTLFASAFARKTRRERGELRNHHTGALCVDTFPGKTTGTAAWGDGRIEDLDSAKLGVRQQR